MKRWAVILLTCALSAGSLAYANNPYITINAKQAHHQKVTTQQAATPHWQSFVDVKPYDLGGPRALFFAQLRLKCSKDPRYVKVRLARITPTGLDTTGTTTWVMGKNAPNNWSGSTWWESETDYPITAQFKVVGGHCYSFQRQLKYWMP